MRTLGFTVALLLAMIAVAVSPDGSLAASHKRGAVTAASTIPQIDPATIPEGELVVESRISTPFHLQVGLDFGHSGGNGSGNGDANQPNFPNGAEVTVEHDRFPGHSSSGWHSHSGPAFVEVVLGTLTLYEANDPTCTATTYSAGTGFLEAGTTVHVARNETGSLVDIYVQYILPPGSGDDGLFIPAPDNPHCPFAS